MEDITIKVDGKEYDVKVEETDDGKILIQIPSKDGVYVQFQYSLNAHKLLKKKFNKVTLDFTPINMPPAFVYRCTL